MLGKLSVPGRPADSAYRRARAFAVGAGVGCFGHLSLVYLFFFLSPSLGDGPI